MVITFRSMERQCPAIWMWCDRHSTTSPDITFHTNKGKSVENVAT